VSTFEQAMNDYLLLRSSLGHQLAEAHWLLPKLVAFLDSQGAHSITVDLALQWAQRSEGPGGYSVAPRRMTVVRGFARYLTGIDARTEVPPLGLVPARDVETLIGAAANVITSPLRVATYQTLLGLLATSGLRIGEAIRLDDSDVDLNDGVLLIRESKFGKTRLVPLHATAIAALKDYKLTRGELMQHRLEPCWFVSERGTRLCYAVVQQTFRRIVTAGGIGNDAPSAPRLHDLRHSFAIQVLLGWYRNGSDVQVKLPALSTYLGHREPRNTYWYLSASPELLALAAARQDRAWLAARS